MLSAELGFEWLCLPMEFEEENRCFTSVPRDDREPEEVALLQIPGEAIPRWVTRDQYEFGLEEETIPKALEPVWKMMTCQDHRTMEGELLWPERFGREFVEGRLKKGLRAEGGNYAVAAQLQQRPIPREGGMFQLQDFQIRDRLPAGGKWVRGWDLAASKDGHAAYTVGVLMGLVNEEVWIADVIRKQASPSEVDAMLKWCADNDPDGVEQCIPQDPAQAGKYQKGAFAKLLHGAKLNFSPETGSKPDRARRLAGQAEAGNLYLVRGTWNDPFIAEACLFPTGDFLDQIDAASRAYGRLVIKPKKRGNALPVTIGG